MRQEMGNICILLIRKRVSGHSLFSGVCLP